MLQNSNYLVSLLVAQLSCSGQLGLAGRVHSDLPEDATSLLQLQQTQLQPDVYAPRQAPTYDYRHPSFNARADDASYGDAGDHPAYLDKYSLRGIGDTETAKEHFLAGMVQALNIDDNAGNLYNWGMASGMKWEDWWDGLMNTYPPSKDGYEIMNFGMVTEPLHKCAADVPSGTPGRSLPFNHTAAANMYTNLIEYSPRQLNNAEVLEISSGRGGGSALISDCYCPARMVGVDLGHAHSLYSQKRYARAGKCPIEFVEGNAMDLPFKNNSFDVVVNVQASHAYPSFRKLAEEVHRVLRPGGAFLFSDFRYTPGLDTDALILHNVFASPMRSVDIGDKVMKSFDNNRLINPFVSTCHVDFGLNGISAATQKVMKAFEPFAPLNPLVKKFMKTAGYHGGMADPTEMLGMTNLKKMTPFAALLQTSPDSDETGYAGLPEGWNKPEMHYADLYNTPKEPLQTPAQLAGIKMANAKSKVKNFFHDLVAYNSTAASGEEMEQARVSPAQALMKKVKGVPTPLSCVNQAGIVVEDGLHRKTLEYRFYIISKSM